MKYRCRNCTYWNFDPALFVKGSAICKKCSIVLKEISAIDRQAQIVAGNIKPAQNLSPEPKAEVTLPKEFFQKLKQEYLRARSKAKDFSPLPEFAEDFP